MEPPRRKHTRLGCYDYNAPGYYFVTLCTEGKQNLLCHIVGTGLPDGPKILDKVYGKIARRQLDQMADFYEDIKLEKYVIMPNHVHLLLRVLEKDSGNLPIEGKFPVGPSGRPVPTQGTGHMRERSVPTQNSKISRFVGTFKRFCNREYGENIWQYRSHDHVIRNERDYQRIWLYIEGNPSRWAEDCFYCAGEDARDG